MGEEGKAWTSLYRCSSLEKVQLKIKTTKAILFNKAFPRYPSPGWNMHSKALGWGVAAAFLLEHRAKNNQAAKGSSLSLLQQR